MCCCCSHLHETQAADKSGLEQIESITKAYGYDFLDLSTDYESIAGIDDSHDFADFEHLNAYGAQKLSSYIGDMAVNQYGYKSLIRQNQSFQDGKSL